MNYRLAAALVVVASALTAYPAVRAHAEPALDATLEADLAKRMAPIVERKVGVVCAARPTAVDPAPAATIYEVKFAYGWALCDGAAAPTLVSVRLKPVPSVEIPTDADRASGRANEMFPHRFQDMLSSKPPAGLTAGLRTALEDRRAPSR